MMIAKKINLLNIKWLAYIAILVCPMGAKILSLSLGYGKISPFRLILLLSVLALVVAKPLIRIYSKDNQYSVIFMYIWLLYAFLSVFWVIDLGAWEKAIFFISVGIVTSVVFINCFTSIFDVKRALFAFTMGITIQSLLGWYEVLTMNYLFIEIEPASMYAFKRNLFGIQCGVPLGMVGNPNDFATLMFIGVLLAFILRKGMSNELIKLCLLGLQFSFILLIIISHSRAALLGTSISLIFVILMEIKQKHRIFLIGLFMIIFAFTVFFNLTSSDLFYVDFSNPNGSDSVRINLIKNGIDFVLQTFGMGVGAGQIENWIENRAVYYVSFYTNMHNWWIEILTGYGVFIFGAYLFYYVKLFVDFYRNYVRNGEERVLYEEVILYKYTSLGLCAIMLGYILTGISSSSNFNSEYIWVFWSICITYQGILNKNMRANNLDILQRKN